MSLTFCPRARGAALSMPVRFASVIFNALATADALDDVPAPDAPPWPPPGSGIPEPRAEGLLAHFDGEEDLSPEPTAAERRAYKSFVRARERWRATKSASRKKIPSFKFQSNDGWVVSRREAAIIADAMDSVVRDHESFELLMDILDLSRRDEAPLRQALDKFRRFNARCAKGDGYAVT